MIEFGRVIAPKDTTLLVPEASDRTWYPRSFLAPINDNEPYLSSALDLVNQLVDQAEKDGCPTEKIGIAGFSQGACLALEYVARDGCADGRISGEQVDDGVANMGRILVFEEIPAGARLDSRKDVALVTEHREHHYLGRLVVVSGFMNEVDAAAIG